MPPPHTATTEVQQNTSHNKGRVFSFSVCRVFCVFDLAGQSKKVESLKVPYNCPFVPQHDAVCYAFSQSGLSSQILVTAEDTSIKRGSSAGRGEKV